ncbi:hypothetical protein BJF92_05690 [Rhizobium rhizosphaerae]|uniref:Uncharacterized protein n=1 Tax=Xaviernesmea rhizosphaerae TaxID=1672749 RepID=A0A1Q9AF91_9HYPH|nr:hypothetical protein BJF92_05690 [Xaviernesmea rhizosphaerae]
MLQSAIIWIGLDPHPALPFCARGAAVSGAGLPVSGQRLGAIWNATDARARKSRPAQRHQPAETFKP